MWPSEVIVSGMLDEISIVGADDLASCSLVVVVGGVV